MKWVRRAELLRAKKGVIGRDGVKQNTYNQKYGIKTQIASIGYIISFS
jgi:hypothetical protein